MALCTMGGGKSDAPTPANGETLDSPSCTCRHPLLCPRIHLHNQHVVEASSSQPRIPSLFFSSRIRESRRWIAEEFLGIGRGRRRVSRFSSSSSARRNCLNLLPPARHMGPSPAVCRRTAAPTPAGDGSSAASPRSRPGGRGPRASRAPGHPQIAPVVHRQRGAIPSSSSSGFFEFFSLLLLLLLRPRTPILPRSKASTPTTAHRPTHTRGWLLLSPRKKEEEPSSNEILIPSRRRRPVAQSVAPLLVVPPSFLPFPSSPEKIPPSLPSLAPGEKGEEKRRAKHLPSIRTCMPAPPLPPSYPIPCPRTKRRR